MKISVDAMGGDHAPLSVIEGVISALNEDSSLEIVLTGDAQLIYDELKKQDYFHPSLTIIPTTEVVTMEDKPSQVFQKKPNSSLVKGIQLVKDRQCDAFVSAGSTGAVLSSSLFLLGRIEGISRPALAVYFPLKPKGFVLCDVGANIDVKPNHFLQFAIMATSFSSHVLGIKDPKIALLNIGEEPTKGGDTYVQGYQQLKEKMPNFIGNIESRYLFESKADVVVCDGFVGNNIVKFAEGWIAHMIHEIHFSLKKMVSSEEEIQLFNNVFMEVMKEYEYEEYGGVPLLGINGICIVSHGSSGPRSIHNAIRVAKKCIDERIVDLIHDQVIDTLATLNTSQTN